MSTCGLITCYCTVAPLFYIMMLLAGYLYNSPIGTNGFSLVFLINFSLKVSSLVLGKGVKPSMTGGWEKSNGTGPDDAALGICCVVASAMSVVKSKNRRGTGRAHFRSHFIIKVQIFKTGKSANGSVSPSGGDFLFFTLSTLYTSSLKRNVKNPADRTFGSSKREHV